jgi:ADP-heptose:LPS heptosyltransferase
VSKSKGRILIIRGGDLREFILTCPVFTALRAQFPETSLEVLGYPRIAQIAKDVGLIDAIRSIETRAAAGFFGRGMPLDEDLGNYFAEFSMIFSYLYDPDGVFQVNVGRVSAGQFVQGPARPKEGENVHAADAFMKPLERLAIFGADPVPRLSFKRAPKLETGSWIAVNPGRDGQHWPIAKWINLLQTLLAKSGYNLFLIADEMEKRNVERLAQALPAKRVEVLNDISLTDLGARLSHCQAFIGVNSGVTQLAAAAGIPCVVIWGAENATIWKPPGENVTLLRNRLGANAITQEEVLAALPMVWSGAE